MAKKPKVKLYVNHGLYQEWQREPGSRQPGLFRTGNKLVLKKIETGFFYVGLAVLYVVRPAKKIPSETRRLRAEVSEFATATARDLKRAYRTREFRGALLVFSVLLLGGVSFIQTGPMVSYALQIKERVLGVTDSGITSLTEAQQLLQNQQVDLAQNKFLQAFQSFDQSKETLSEAGTILNSLADILPQKREGENLIETAQHISRAGFELTQAYAILKGVKFSAEGIQSEQNTKEALTELEAHMNTAASAIGQAKTLLDSSSDSSIPDKHRLQFAEAKEKILILDKSLTASADLITMLNQILLGDKHVLLLMQNNNELRATGGFIGTYGAMDLNNGKINQLHISSIYDLDGQLASKILPPHPLYAVNNRWYMRDSNWFANFPESAKKITSFYEKEGGESPDLILAITPHIVTDLLAVVGPIAMPQYNITLTSDNFVELTQIETSVNYDREQNTPKQLVADFVPVLLQKLSTLTPDQYVRVAELFQQNLNGKHILFYSRDPKLEAKFESYNWSGTIRETDRDYLSIVSSNLGGTKTDTYIDQKVALESVVQEDGSIQNTLTITKTNPLPEQPQYKNTSFLRVYVPKGSTLISSQGFTFKALEVPPLEDAKPDDAIQEWESRLLKNVVSQTVIGEESGKTIFGNWLEIDGGQTKTVTITYTLPYKLQSTDRQSLLLQKQAGSLPWEFIYAFRIADYRLLWKSNSFTGPIQSQTLEQKLSIQKDEFFGSVLSK